MRLRLVLMSVLLPVLVIATAIVAGRWTGDAVSADTRSATTTALDSLPADTQVAGVTDWSGIRQVLGVGSATTASDRAVLTDDAALRDLSTRSVLGAFTEELHDAYGWSPADLDWEAYGQANDGAVMVARLDESVSLSSVRARLAKLGYSRDGRVWTIGDGSGVSRELATTLNSVAVVDGQRLIVAGDRPAYVSTVLETIDRDAPSLLSVRSAADVASALAGADSMLLQSGAFSCDGASLADSGADVRAQARAALERAGELVEPEFAGRALDGDTRTTETLRFAFGFRSTAVASGQLRVRTALASGPFIGRSGRIEDSLVPRSSSVHGTTVLLRFEHDPDSTAYMTGDGPLLFAACGP